MYIDAAIVCALNQEIDSKVVLLSARNHSINVSIRFKNQL